MALIGSPHGCSSFHILRTWYSDCFRRGFWHSVQLYTSFSYYVFTTYLCKTNAWSTLKHLLGSVQVVLCMQNNGAWMRWMHCVYLQLHKAHWLLTILKIVCALCFAFRNHAQNAFQSCPCHSVHNDSATFCQCLAYPESSVPSVFCIPNLCANCSSVMLLPFATLCTWFPPHCTTLLTIVNVVCPLGFASGVVTSCACLLAWLSLSCVPPANAAVTFGTAPWLWVTQYGLTIYKEPFSLCSCCSPSSLNPWLHPVKWHYH